MRGVLDVLGLTYEQVHEQEGAAEAVQARVASAYAAFANGEASSEDAGIILVDLASYSGYYTTADIDASEAVLRTLNGRREMFQRIAEAMVFTGVTLDGLHGAVVRNPAIL